MGKGMSFVAGVAVGAAAGAVLGVMCAPRSGSETRAMAADNSAQLSRVKRNLVRALREDVTPRQREVLLLYYAEQLNTRQIGEKLGGDKSTVARTIKRGEARLRRCLRYGAEAFLNAAAEGPP